MYSLSRYDYTLPDELIAQEAIHPHHDARLMVIDKVSGHIIDESTFWNLDRLIPEDRVLFFNNSRVLPARIRLKGNILEKKDGEKNTISEGEILFLQKKNSETFEALIRPGKKFAIGTKIYFAPSVSLEVLGVTDAGRILRAQGDTIESIMRTYGELPLPPYIAYSKEKEADYQTTFAKVDGSVAAPTASLHFTEELLEKLPHEKSYLTLHVGLGTFQPIDTDDVRDYHIHSELIEVPIGIFDTITRLKMSGKKILAVGTTACRTLESLPYLWKGLDRDERKKESQRVQDFWDELTVSIAGDIVKNIRQDGSSWVFETEIYIYPGIPFRIVDDLITNFHLPGSSLLVLVSAFLGQKETMQVYAHAIKEKYRFFSFGDGMYIRS